MADSMNQVAEGFPLAGEALAHEEGVEPCS